MLLRSPPLWLIFPSLLFCHSNPVYHNLLSKQLKQPISLPNSSLFPLQTILHAAARFHSLINSFVKQLMSIHPKDNTVKQSNCCTCWLASHIDLAGKETPRPNLFRWSITYGTASSMSFMFALVLLAPKSCRSDLEAGPGRHCIGNGSVSYLRKPELRKPPVLHQGFWQTGSTFTPK